MSTMTSMKAGQRLRRLWLPVLFAGLFLLLSSGSAQQAPTAAPPKQDAAADQSTPTTPTTPAKQEAPAKKPFKPEELEQIVAPIALYPDSLLSQVFMASTYPLEVIEAARWAKANKDLKGDKLTQELEKKTWDASVKSLVNFSQVLAMMDEKLDWTQKLGDAFLAQQKEVMDTVQKLRAKAQEKGNLKSTEQQKVVVEEKVIKIESTSPQVVYVPTYNPTVVYGTWPYPAYPPYYYYPPGYAAAGAAISFGVGFAMGAAWGYAWGGCNWHGGEVDIDVNRNVEHNRNINRDQAGTNRAGTTSGKSSWQHDPQHRKGASYRDTATAQKFNKQASPPTAQSREAFRGRAEQGRQQLSSPAERSRASAAASRPAASQTRPAASQTRSARSQTRSGSALGGYEGGNSVKNQANRGYQSRQSSASSSRSRGGSRAATSSGSRSSGSRSFSGGSRGGSRGGGGGRR